MRPIKLQAIGADPEVFFRTNDNKPQSVEGLLGGTKRNPLPMQGMAAGFAIQEDNVAAEYNIPPAKTFQEFDNNINLGLKYLTNIAKKKGLRVAIVPALHFPIEQLKTEHAQTLGCDPDLNIWTLSSNRVPRPPETLRTAAGHIHASWDKPNAEQQEYFGKVLDVYLGLPSIVVTAPSERRTLYGRAGAVRLKTYGLEYRVLDNFWLTKKAWREKVFQNTFQAARRLNDGGTSFTEELDNYGDQIQDVINNHDQAAAKWLINKFAVPPFPIK